MQNTPLEWKKIYDRDVLQKSETHRRYHSKYADAKYTLQIIRWGDTLKICITENYEDTAGRFRENQYSVRLDNQEIKQLKEFVKEK